MTEDNLIGQARETADDAIKMIVEQYIAEARAVSKAMHGSYNDKRDAIETFIVGRIQDGVVGERYYPMISTQSQWETAEDFPIKVHLLSKIRGPTLTIGSNV